MLGNRGRAMRQGAAQMRRHPLAAEKYLDGLLRDAGLNLLMNEVVRDAVVMLGDLDVIITRQRFHSAYSYGSSGKGVSAG